jgi:hypothetical protein
MSAVGLGPIVTSEGKSHDFGSNLARPTVAAQKSPTEEYAKINIAETRSYSSNDEMLFDARAVLKVAVSQISMHLSAEWRASVFKQIDFLHNLEDWEESSDLVIPESFRTFLRFVVFAEPRRIPALAIAPGGNPVATWLLGDKRVYVEFLPRDIANAILTKNTDRGPEALSWRGPITNLKSIITVFESYLALGW